MIDDPLRTNNVPYLKFDEKMSEVLLFRPLLLSMGFNLEEHLVRERAQFNDSNFFGIGFEPMTVQHAPTGSLARLMFDSTARDNDEDRPPAMYLGDSDDDGSHEKVLDSRSEAVAVPSPTRFLTDMDVGQHCELQVRSYLDENAKAGNGQRPATGARVKFVNPFVRLCCYLLAHGL